MSIRPLTSLTVLVLSVALTGCLTPRAKPTPSAAVAAARKGVGVKPPACQVGDLGSVSPTLASFPFDEPTVDDEGVARLRRAADWLNCNPGVPVVILPTADNHGDAPHKADLALARGRAALAVLRDAGAKAATIQVAAVDAADPLTGPHLVINADGRGW